MTIQEAVGAASLIRREEYIALSTAAKGGGGMITIKIGAIERNIENADPSWINQQLNGLKRDGHGVCVIIKIQEDSVNMTLGTPGCGGIGGGGRPPNAGEQRIFDLWNKHHLDKPEVQGGEVVSFLRDLRRVLG